MNTTEGTDTLIDYITPISAGIVALLTCIGTLIAYKTNSRRDEGITLQVENRCTVSDIDKFVKYARQNGVSINGEVHVRDVINTVRTINPELLDTKEYMYISDNAAGLADDDVRAAVISLISMILNHSDV
jgi:hypothetical protein